MMEELINALEKMGCDMKSTLLRFLGDEEFYAECLTDMLADEGFARLGTELEAEDAKAAFATAHMLKGIISNMGIRSMLDIIVQIVEPLRGGNAAGLMPLYEELMSEKAKYDALVAN